MGLGCLCLFNVQYHLANRVTKREKKTIQTSQLIQRTGSREKTEHQQNKNNKTKLECRIAAGASPCLKLLC
jgi:hypothetical protein